MLKKYLYEKDILFFLLNFILFYLIFGHTLDYGRTFDDVHLVQQFNNSPGDAKLISTYFYAEFHFYPIYFLSHELDNFITFFYSYFVEEIENIKIAKNTNFIFHIFNSYLVFIILKILFIPKNILEKLILYFSSLIFLIHPIASQIVFNVTTRNESLALFFSLLSFIYAFKLFEKKSFMNFFYVIVLYFFALCSKLAAVTFIAIIPLAILLVNSKIHELKRNFIKVLPIFFSLLITFVIFYLIKNNFVNKYSLNFYTDIQDLISNFLIALKFYLRGLLFPFEHIYVYADNYNNNYSLQIFLIFLIIIILSIYLYVKFSDPILMIIILWLSATLSMPILFNLIETGFPLISKLTERYQYSSIPTLSILFAWLLLKFINQKYLNFFILNFLFLILVFFTMIKVDRSYVYKDNYTFFTKADENSPSNVFEYSFTTPLEIANREKNEKVFLFNLYQLYSLDPTKAEYILHFMDYFRAKDNKTGHDFFLNKFKTDTKYLPPEKFRLAKFYFDNGGYVEAESLIDEIFNDFDALVLEFKEKGIQVEITYPEVDDVYFLKGLVQKKLNKLEDSLASFTLATLYNPLHATALYNSSLILKELGQLELAKRHFKDAIELNPFLRETVNNKMHEKLLTNE